MPEYRLRLVTRAGKTGANKEVEIDCANDQEAIWCAKVHVNGQDVEVYEGARFVARVSNHENREGSVGTDRSPPS